MVAGGAGARFGSAKQLARLGGVPVIDRSVDVARDVGDGTVVVVAAGLAWAAPAGVETVEGGATRSASVRAGLERVPDGATEIVVHDAARPLASRVLFEAVIAAVRGGADAAVPAVPIADTVKRVEGSRVVATLDRHDLVAVQTPQAFRATVLRAAHRGEPEGTDDAALVEALGATVVVVDGERHNVKLTVPEDLVLMERLIGSGLVR